jgi:hypothetical protein
MTHIESPPNSTSKPRMLTALPLRIMERKTT